ncbi:MAG: MFS transporter, partial [Cytophagales bacterium]|nr:MFS transporter [Cytophagales bacterium]
MPFHSITLSNSRPLRYVAFFYLYVMQGLPSGFALTAVANYLIAEGASAAAVGSFVAVVGLPWAVQFAWGPVIDRFQQSAMGRRKPWVVLSQLVAFLASLGILTIDDPVRQLGALSLAFFVHSVFASIQDASVDAMAIGITPENERGRVNAFMRGGMLTGVGLGAALFAYLIRAYGFFPAALAQSLLLLLFTALTFFLRERPGDALLPTRRTLRGTQAQPDGTPPDLRWLFTELFRGLTTRQSLRLFGASALVYLCISLFTRALPVHLIQELHWSDTSVSILRGTYGTVVTLGVIFTGGVLADRFGARRLLRYVTLFVGAFLLAFNLLAPWWVHEGVAMGGQVLWYMIDPIFSVAAMPVLMAICRKGVEGSQFTTYMALVNLVDIAGAYVSGQAMTWVKAPVIGLVGGGLVLLAALLAFPSTRQDKQ